MPGILLIIVSAIAFVVSPTIWAASGAISVQHFCNSDLGRGVSAQFVIDSTYSFSKKGQKKYEKKLSRSRALWNITCDSRSGSCNAARLSLDNIESEERIGYFDLRTFTGMHIANQKGKVFTIAWGPYRPFVIDLGLGKILYVDSGDEGEGRGEASCDGVR